MLTKDKLVFLKSQGLTAADVYDGRGQSSHVWKAGVRSEGKTVVLGTACSAKGHRLRTRSGHSAQCDTAKLGYREHMLQNYLDSGRGQHSAALTKALVKFNRTAIEDFEDDWRNAQR